MSSRVVNSSTVNEFKYRLDKEWKFYIIILMVSTQWGWHVNI